MTQTATFRSNFRFLPGFIYTPQGGGHETESIEVPYTAQQFTFTFGGASPLAAGDYVINWTSPTNGALTTTITSDGALTFAAGANLLAETIGATNGVLNQFTATSDGVSVVTVVAKSANTDWALPTTSVPGADTLTAAESVAPAAPGLRMGLWYIYDDAATALAITGTPRGAFAAKLPVSGTAIADLRGVVARPYNQTTLSPTFQDATSGDAYTAGQAGFGCLRGSVCTVVDPASGTMSPGSQVHVVKATGTYSVVGAVASAADGGNTLRLDNTTPVRARVVAKQESFTMGNYSGLCVLLEVNQTN